MSRNRRWFAAGVLAVLCCLRVASAELSFREVAHELGQVLGGFATPEGKVTVLHVRDGAKWMTVLEDRLKPISTERQIEATFSIFPSDEGIGYMLREPDRTFTFVRSGERLWSSPTPLGPVVLLRSGSRFFVVGSSAAGLQGWKLSPDLRTGEPATFPAGADRAGNGTLIGGHGHAAIHRRDGLYLLRPDFETAAIRLHLVSKERVFEATIAVGRSQVFFFVVPSEGFVTFVPDEIRMLDNEGAVLWRGNTGRIGVAALTTASAPGHRAIALLWKSKESLRRAELLIFQEDGVLLGRRPINRDAILVPGTVKDTFVVFEGAKAWLAHLDASGPDSKR